MVPRDYDTSSKEKRAENRDNEAEKHAEEATMHRQSSIELHPLRVSLKNGVSVTIRPLRANDGEALGRLYERVTPADRRFYAPHGLTQEMAQQKAARAASPRFLCLVMETADREIGGYAWYSWEKEESREGIFGICIRKDLQGLGAGKALMKRILEIAKEIGPSIMSLTVQLANPRALALYRSMGFKIVRQQLREADGEPEYYMEKKVR